MSNEPDEVNSGALATAIVLVAFSTLAVALVVTALVRNTTREVRGDRDQTQERALRHLKSEQLASLTAAPAYRDRATGRVSVPIDRAMALVLADVRANPLAMSPGYKPPEEKPECDEGQSCVPCAADETCTEGACPAGEKCGVSCPPGEECPAADGENSAQTGESALAPEAAQELGASPAAPPSPAAPKAPGAQPTPAAQPSPAAPKAPAAQPSPAAPKAPAAQPTPVAPKAPAPAPAAPKSPAPTAPAPGQ